MIFGQYSDVPHGVLGTKGNPATSCEVIREAGFQHSGVYFIGFSSTSSVHKVWCELSLVGGGWSLLAKGSASGSSFKYDSSLWSTDRLLNAHEVSLKEGDAKYSVFNALEIKELLVHWPTKTLHHSQQRQYWLLTLKAGTTALSLFSKSRNRVASEWQYPTSGKDYPPPSANFDSDFFSIPDQRAGVVQRLGINTGAARLGYSFFDRDGRTISGLVSGLGLSMPLSQPWSAGDFAPGVQKPAKLGNR